MTGIICIDKDKDITSFGVVAKLRGILGEKKAGHTGTLDPMATGVLPVMLGGATKFLDFLPQSDKRYEAKFLLGKTTDTLDITGKTLSENEVTAKKEDILKILPEFTGKILQYPPMYSAKSVDGVRLYDLARQGIEIERKPCEVEIKVLELIRSEGNEYTIDVLCSKGTYIRSLVDDIGKALGCGAVLTELRRTLACGFSSEDTVALSELQRRKDSGEGFDDLVMGIERIFESYHKVVISEAQSVRFSNGGALDIKRVKNPPKDRGLCTVYSFDNRFLGLGKNENEQLRVLRLLIRK
ncbi:MAG: tRNA pseudouridine(55) synthase TruB [Eubacterium sp.]|nr:tRNA pseudouridine(55) synthase TruB [Eubacterium sp.]